MDALDSLSREELLERLREWERFAGSESNLDGSPRASDALTAHDINRSLTYLYTRITELFDKAPVGYVLVDRRGIVRQINELASELLGHGEPRMIDEPGAIGEGGIIGEPLIRYLPGRPGGKLVMHIDQVFEMNTRSTATFEFPESQRWLQFESVLYRDREAGEDLCWITITDISPRKRVEESLRVAHATFAALVQNISDPLWSIDCERKITAHNASFTNWRHILFDEEGRFRPNPITRGRLLIDWRELYARVLAGESFSVERVYSYGEDAYHFELSFHPIEKGGTTMGATILAKNITALKRASEELRVAKEKAETSNDLKSSFLSHVSHEMRTPLNAMLGFTALLRKKLVDPQLVTYLNGVIKNGQRLTETTNDLLDFLRLEANRLHLQIQPTDLASELRRSVELARSLAMERKLELRSSVLDHPVMIEADAKYLQQILGNLLGNALKFTERGFVEVALTTREGDAVVTVSDTGRGISPGFLPHIFEEYVQEDYRSEILGAGLGLPIASKLAKLMHGAISAKSTRGAGSTFTLTIPLAKN